MSVRQDKKGEDITGENMITVLKQLSGYLRIIQYLERMGIWEAMTTFLLDNSVTSADQFADEKIVSDLRNHLQKQDFVLGTTRPCSWKPSCYEFDAAYKDKAHLMVTVGPQIPLIPEYHALVKLYPQIKELIVGEYAIDIKDRQIKVADWKELLEVVRKESFKGSHLQRYKGLGEMNPEQLWETTMNADTRRLVQVQIEDMVAAGITEEL